MSVVRMAAIILSGAATTGLCLAAAAGADPGFDPCRSSVPFVCRMFPVMPGLDHDIDLSQDPDAWTGGQDPADQPSTNQPATDLNGG